MENNEKYIARQLRNHREDLDLDGLWSDVSPHIPKEKKRRRLGFWVFDGLLAVMFMTSIIMISNLPKSIDSQYYTDAVEKRIDNDESVLAHAGLSAEVDKMDRTPISNNNIPNQENVEKSVKEDLSSTKEKEDLLNDADKQSATPINTNVIPSNAKLNNTQEDKNKKYDEVLLTKTIDAGHNIILPEKPVVK